MGTVFEISLAVPCSDKNYDIVFLEAQKLLDSIEAEVSLYQPESPLNQLNKNGQVSSKYVHLSELLNQSLLAHNKTNGNFDVTILPVLKKIRESFEKTQKPPTSQTLENLRPIIDVTKIQRGPRAIKLQNKGMQITFDGIAKGYAVDKVAEILESYQLKNYLVNFSGNMKWSGRRADQQMWKIVIWNPIFKTGIPLEYTEKGAIASSGPEINYFSENKKWHHIIDPKTLRPANKWSQTTIVGRSAEECDVLSTATFTSNKKDIAENILKSYPEIQVWAISLDGKPQKLSAH